MSKSWSNSFRYRVLTALVIFLLALAYYLRVALGPLIVAALFAYLMNPIVEWVSKHPRLSRKAGVNIVFLAGIAIVIAIPSNILPIIVDEIITISKDFRAIYALIIDYISTPINIFEWTIEPQILLPAIEDIPLLDVGFITGEAFHLIEVITLNALWTLVILAAVYFLLLDWGKLKKFMITLAPADYHDDLKRLYHDIVAVWNGYLRGNLILMLITAVLFSVAWSIIGLPAGLLLGIMMGLFSIVPDVGAMVAAGISVLVALIEGSTVFEISNLWFAALVFVTYFVLINVKNLWLRSILFGRSVHMHEGLVFILIMVSVIVQGILGAIIVIPLVASLWVIGRYLLNKLYDLPPFPEDENLVDVILEDAK